MMRLSLLIGIALLSGSKAIRLGHKSVSRAAESYVDMFDKDSNGRVSEEEFLDQFKNLHISEEAKNSIEDLYKNAAKGDDGMISTDDLHSLVDSAR